MEPDACVIPSQIIGITPWSVNDRMDRVRGRDMSDVWERAPRPTGTALAIAVPVGLLVSAFALWWLSDRLLWIGPFDRAAFGWIFVVPIWLAVAPAAGLVWARVATRERLLAATLLVAMIGAVVALAYWLASRSTACEFGSLWTADATAARALILGIGVGAGPAAAGLIAAANGRGRVVRTVVIGTIGSAVTSMFSLLLIAMVLMVPMCQRPPAG